MLGNDKYKLSKKAAQSELEKMFDFYEIDIDEIEDKLLKDSIKSGYGRLVKAVRLGRLEIKTDTDFKVIQHLRSGSDIIEYRIINGPAKKAMSGKAEDDHYGRIYALMGSLSGLGETAIAKLEGVDLSLAEVLGMIFLSV